MHVVALVVDVRRVGSFQILCAFNFKLDAVMPQSVRIKLVKNVLREQ